MCAMAVEGARIYADVNAVVGGYLRDLAFAQSSPQKMFGYKRAAAAILALDTPLPDLAEPDGTLPRIAGIGPGSTRVIREVLQTGESSTVEAAIERRGCASGILLDEIASPHAAAAVAGADEGVAAFGAGLGEGVGGKERRAGCGRAGHLYELTPRARRVGQRGLL